ncbi:hypothetical protein [Corynebacterium renale]|uniref:Uncharacterized protein n=1 Tax=Corynebacterium renale TaxID=1724 RepID=A0A2A9DNL0_9CORY|nr:hypothetical protein [Corynebacterium renale]PFG27946.1 hypothetical protein ATK06_1028 [Corynebacterium renale]SQI21581.1 Uncharacterised protein [Corynebacterium renale]
MSSPTSNMPRDINRAVTEEDVARAREKALDAFQRKLDEIQREEAKNQRGIRKYLHRLGLV